MKRVTPWGLSSVRDRRVHSAGLGLEHGDWLRRRTAYHPHMTTESPSPTFDTTTGRKVAERYPGALKTKLNCFPVTYPARKSQRFK